MTDTTQQEREAEARGQFVVEPCIRIGYRGGKRADGWNIKRDGKQVEWCQWKNMAEEKAEELNAKEQGDAR